MKITTKELKKIILQEMNDLVSTGVNPQKVLGGFETMAFENHMRAIMENMSALDAIIREDTALNRRTLILFKEKVLQDLHVAVSHLEGAITDRLKKQDGNL